MLSVLIANTNQGRRKMQHSSLITHPFKRSNRTTICRGRQPKTLPDAGLGVLLKSIYLVGSWAALKPDKQENDQHHTHSSRKLNILWGREVAAAEDLEWQASWVSHPWTPQNLPPVQLLLATVWAGQQRLFALMDIGVNAIYTIQREFPSSPFF